MESRYILTEDFVMIPIPNLTGTEKQIAFGEKIRQKYINIFNNKLSKYGILDVDERKEFTQKFENYLNQDLTTRASYWIENHCAFCGCWLVHEDNRDVCSNSFCKFVREK